MGKLNGHNINVTINNKRVTKLAVNGKTAHIHNLHVPARAGNKPDVHSDNTRWPWKFFTYRGADDGRFYGKICVITNTAALCFPEFEIHSNGNGSFSRMFRYHAESTLHNGIGEFFENETIKQLPTEMIYYANRDIYFNCTFWSNPGGVALQYASVSLLNTNGTYTTIFEAGAHDGKYGPTQPWTQGSYLDNAHRIPYYFMQNLGSLDFHNDRAFDVFAMRPAVSEAAHDIIFRRS